MKERPILFSGEMVRAILEGRKTQTRRPVKPQPHEATTAFRDIPDTPFWYGAINTHNDFGEEFYPNPAQGNWKWKYPYGVPGDRLWVREPWKTAKVHDALSPKQMIQACRDAGWKSGRAWAPIEYLADGRRENWDTFPPETGRYRNSRFMPRDYSRLTLEVTEVRVQRLQEISEDDARVEGCDPQIIDGFVECGTRKTSFRLLWESINGPGSWEANPWVWSISFKRVTA